jgi:hypothetical protein
MSIYQMNLLSLGMLEATCSSRTLNRYTQKIKENNNNNNIKLIDITGLQPAPFSQLVVIV